MLSELKIENVAVIEKACAIFTGGFNVLTGETGAGKSILIDSINAILGNRTSRDIVRTGALKACIWATFKNIGNVVKNQIEQAGYEKSDELLLYREISQDGKSICRVNGMPATASVVRDICSNLINIHGQHDNQSLMNPQNHITVLDSFAQNESVHREYYALYKELLILRKEIKTLNIDEDEKERKISSLKYNIEEIEMAKLRIGEEEELLATKNRIRHSQAILKALNMAYSALTDTEDALGACSLLSEAATAIDGVNSITESYALLAEKLNELFYSSKECASELNEFLSNSDFDAISLDELEERLDLYYRLKNKYNADTIHIIEYLDNAKEELAGISLTDEKLACFKEKQRELFNKARLIADKLTQTRIDAFERFEKEIVVALEFLNMPSIRLNLIHTKGALTSIGQDTLEFYISPNPGEAPKPLAKIASGGELSRIMLAIKSALADKDNIATVIYDEIDTGVSGLAASRIGEMLLQTSDGRQIICITHTAQIASKAHNHLLIKKSIEENRTYTQIISLEDEDRVSELARIISGDKLTPLALANAREMLYSN